MRQGKNPPIKAGRGNPIRGKECQVPAKDSEKHQLPLLGVPQNHQANNSCDVYAEDLGQTHAGLVLAASVSELTWALSSSFRGPFSLGFSTLALTLFQLPLSQGSLYLKHISGINSKWVWSMVMHSVNSLGESRHELNDDWMLVRNWHLCCCHWQVLGRYVCVHAFLGQILEI